MEIIKRIFRKDIIILSEDEMDAVDWSKIDFGCIYLDIWGKIHLELNHKGFRNHFFNTNWWDLFIDQRNFYKKLPYRLLKACKTKPAEDLIGARQFIYSRKHRFLLPSNVGILPWAYMKERGDLDRNPDVGEIRRNAFALLFEKLDDVAVRLGANVAYFPTATIPEEKMRKYGCFPHEVKGLKDHFTKFIFTFPIRKIKIYLKPY